MKIGITCWSLSNPVISCMASRILQISGIDSIHFFRIKRPLTTIIRHAVDKYGLSGVMEKIWFRLNPAYNNCEDERVKIIKLLELYAKEHELFDWNIINVKRKNLKTHVFTSLNSNKLIGTIHQEGIDLLINNGGGIFREELIRSVPVGILNAHMGQLPEYRGMNTLEWSLFYLDKPQVTIHYIDKGIDTGDIIFSGEIMINCDDTISLLRAKSYPVSIELIAEAVELILKGDALRIKQDINKGLQYYLMHPRLLEIAEKNITCFR